MPTTVQHMEHDDGKGSSTADAAKDATEVPLTDIPSRAGGQPINNTSRSLAEEFAAFAGTEASAETLTKMANSMSSHGSPVISLTRRMTGNRTGSVSSRRKVARSRLILVRRCRSAVQTSTVEARNGGSQRKKDCDPEEDQTLTKPPNDYISEEAELMRKSRGEEENPGLKEEPMDGALWSLAVRNIMPDLGDEEENYARTIDGIIQWKMKTMEEDFDRVKRAVKGGGVPLRSAVKGLSKKLLRNHSLRPCLVAGICIKTMATSPRECQRQVLDVMQGICRQEEEDFGEFAEECMSGYVEDEWLDDSPFENDPGFRALDGGRNEVDPKGLSPYHPFII